MIKVQQRLLSKRAFGIGNRRVLRQSTILAITIVVELVGFQKFEARNVTVTNRDVA